MKTRKMMAVVLLACTAASTWSQVCNAQCCLDSLFAGCGNCFRKAPPAYAVAPVPIMAPIAAAPPVPVVVPVQQVSYVPETTYRTQYQCVPVTSYKPSCEIDPCTGCPRDCMEQVTNYEQRAVNVPVTQYRAVYSTKYVQMQPGYAVAPGSAVVPGAVPGPAGIAASPFAAPTQTTPQAWGSAGSDIPQQSIAAPTLPQGAVGQPMMPQPTFQQQIVPQSGTYAAPSPVQPQPSLPPTLAPTPSLKPIPELPRTMPGQTGSAGAAPSTPLAQPSPALKPIHAPAGVPGGNTPGTTPSTPDSNGTGSIGMPTVPGTGPGAATGAFPRLLEPTSHTTSWQPAAVSRSSAYPTAALPVRWQQ
ncbi:MAG: hypothetical protein WCQ91_00635 [Planctomycetota bacterium]